MDDKINAVEGVGLHTLDLKPYGIVNPRQKVYRNPSHAFLVEAALKYEPHRSALMSNGSLCALSGAKTGRSPSDKRIVETAESKEQVFWESDACIPLPERSFDINRQRAVDYLSTRDRLYVVDAWAGHNRALRKAVRFIVSRAYHGIFTSVMFIKPTEEELATFEPEYTVFNAGEFPANVLTEGMTSNTSIDFHLERKQIVIAGTQYAGEQKKSMLSAFMWEMPALGHLPLHAAASMSRDGKSVSVYCGLSGTGKTTLSADPGRLLIGDDEHVWFEGDGDRSAGGIFNVEGGFYAKTINLSEASEPLLYRAIRWGALVENVGYDAHTREIDYADTSLTLNTRVACPLEHQENAVLPEAAGPHPNNVIFLCYDAFGVLPPVSRLSPAQAQYHFVSGYTSKVAGTEQGVTEPSATFSACFGEAFIVRHPARYGELLAEKMKKHGANAWLINTGFVAGGYGKGGHRCPLKYTRAILDAIHDGSLAAAPGAKLPVFGFDVPSECAGVPSELLDPRVGWADKADYDATLRKLGGLFEANFAKYKAGSPAAVVAAGPQL